MTKPILSPLPTEVNPLEQPEVDTPIPSKINWEAADRLLDASFPRTSQQSVSSVRRILVADGGWYAIKVGSLKATTANLIYGSFDHVVKVGKPGRWGREALGEALTWLTPAGTRMLVNTDSILAVECAKDSTGGVQ